LRQVFAARWLLAGDGAWLADGALVVERGKIAKLCTSRAAAKRAARGERWIDLGAMALLPGLVDAHAHLELSGMQGMLPRTKVFPTWIRALIGLRRSKTEDELTRDARAGMARLLASGVTCVGDIDSSGAVTRALQGQRLRVRHYREVLDAGDRERSAGALRLARSAGARGARLYPGFSPHAPYTLSPELWRALGGLRAWKRAALAIHWAETEAERAWLERGTGSFGALLAHSPRTSGLALIESAGCLRPGTALIHGNHATAGERARVARSGAVLVHCPGTHAFFGRARFELEAWQRANVCVALGTDSLASNAELDMLREMALVRRSHPSLRPTEVLAMATSNAARALALPGSVGTLAPGAHADWCAFDTRGVKTPGALLEAVTSGTEPVHASWCAGRPAFTREGAESGL
jgi:aminodeoxyfutalosine deaminase